jgi:hypothetical protein
MQINHVDNGLLLGDRKLCDRIRIVGTIVISKTSIVTIVCNTAISRQKSVPKSFNVIFLGAPHSCMTYARAIGVQQAFSTFETYLVFVLKYRRRVAVPLDEVTRASADSQDQQALPIAAAEIIRLRKAPSNLRHTLPVF